METTHLETQITNTLQSFHITVSFDFHDTCWKHATEDQWGALYSLEKNLMMKPVMSKSLGLTEKEFANTSRL